MGDYSSSIKKLNGQLLAFINRYEILEDKDPISNPLLKRLKKQINSLNTTSNQYVHDLEKQLNIFNSFFEDIMTNHKDEEEKIQQHLNASIEVITNKYEKKIQELNDEIKKLEKTAQDKLSELKQDIEFFIIASSQRASIFETECEENIRHYQYQIANAEETYNENICQYNQELAKNNEKLNKSFSGSLQNFDENTEKMIERLNKKIDKCNSELEDLAKKLTDVRNQMKEKFRQESIYLNEEIKKLNAEKNKTIVNARTRYTKSQNTSAMEKENKRQEYQIESQKILKDFVYNMTELDEYTNKIKNSYNETIEKENRNYNYKLLDLHKRQEQDLLKIAEKGYKLHQEYDKYTHGQMKIKNKIYFHLNNEIKESQYRTIQKHEFLYQKELEKTRHNKTLLDLDKNYSLKILNEKEQSDNKYYQELNNIYENDMSLLIQISNMKYNQQANEVKTKSINRNKELEKDLDVSEANFQKAIEEIQTNINILKYEIDGTLELKKLIHQFEENNYKRQESHLAVTTLLEIEKCKMLDKFNHRQYQHNVLNAKNNLNYSKKKLEIENQQFEALTNIKISRIQATLQRDIVNANYKIREDQIYEQEDKEVQNRNTLYELDSINHTVLYQRFKGEVKIIHQILSVFILLIKEMETFMVKFLSIFFTSIPIRPTYFDIIQIFIKDFLSIMTGYYTNLVENLNEHECDIIYKRIAFEEKFKFKSYYSDLLESYEADRKKLLNKKKSITDTVDNYSRTIDSFSSRIYNLMEQNLVLRQKLRNKLSKTQKEELKKENQSNNQKIIDLKKKIEDILKLKDILSKDDESITNELKTLDKEYNVRVEEIKDMQYSSAISFHNLRKSISKFSNEIIEKIDSLNTKPITINYLNTLAPINEYRNQLVKLNTSVFKELYHIVHVFYIDTYESIQKNKKYLLTKFKNDVEHIHIRANNAIEENKKEYDKKVSTHLQELKALDNKNTAEEKRFAIALQKNDEDYEDQIKQILDDRKKSIARFYKEYYAMSDNLTEIKENYKMETDEKERQFQEDKIALTNRIIKEKETVSANLISFKQAKEELINHLPAATKFQSQQLTKETKEINADIDLDIKNAKLKFNNQRKLIQRNMSVIQTTLDQILYENELKHEKSILKEKRNHTSTIRHLEKNIKITLS